MRLQCDLITGPDVTRMRRRMSPASEFVQKWTGTWRPQMRAYTTSFWRYCAVEAGERWSKWWTGEEWREGEPMSLFVEQRLRPQFRCGWRVGARSGGIVMGKASVEKVSIKISGGQGLLDQKVCFCLWLPAAIMTNFDLEWHKSCTELQYGLHDCSNRSLKK